MPTINIVYCRFWVTLWESKKTKKWIHIYVIEREQGKPIMKTEESRTKSKWLHAGEAVNVKKKKRWQRDGNAHNGTCATKNISSNKYTRKEKNNYREHQSGEGEGETRIQNYWDRGTNANNTKTRKKKGTRQRGTGEKKRVQKAYLNEKFRY